MLKKLSNILITLLLLVGCIEPYEFDIEEGETRIVVQGRITNEPGPYEVILTESANYSITVDGFSTYLSGAEVYIIDDLGNYERMVEGSKGRYYTLKTGMQGEIGRSYYLEISLPNGDTYRSEPEVLTESSEINRLYYEFEPGSAIKKLGFYVYLDAIDPLDETNFYKWESISWWLYTNDCWNKIRDFDPFNIQSDENINGNKIARKLIKRVPYNSRLPYVVTAWQLSLSAQAFNYLESMNKQVVSSGTMFDPPPTFLRGNIENVNDQEKLALGYFYAAGVSKLEIAIDRTAPETSPVNPVYPLPDPVYCGIPCNYMCVAGGGICGIKPCPPACNTLPGVTYYPPESWPIPHIRCDE
ncbi:DUF4249 domain-containing protein [Bacteroidota bacterium]